MDATPVASTLSWLGTLTAGLLVGAPMVSVRRQMTESDVGAQSMTYYVMQLLNCVATVVYGMLIDVTAVVVCNAWGIATALYCIYGYLRVVRLMEDEGRVAPFATYRGSLRTAVAAVTACAVFCTAIAALNVNSHVSASRISGVMAGATSVAMLASPLGLVQHILATRSADVLSPQTISCAIANGLVWTVYGLLINDGFIVVPNIVGLGCSSLLASLLLKYGDPFMRLRPATTTVHKNA